MSLFNDIKKGFPPSIEIPTEMEAIVDWYQTTGQMLGGLFEFAPDYGQRAIKDWFGKADLSHRFGVFGALPDGAPVAFWINDENDQRIVMLTAEPMDRMVLADTFLDFMRLVAIGYDDFAYTDFRNTLAEHNQDTEQGPEYGSNPNFQQWLIETYGTHIPETGDEAVNIHNRSFADWVERQLAD